MTYDFRLFSIYELRQGNYAKINKNKTNIMQVDRHIFKTHRYLGTNLNNSLDALFSELIHDLPYLLFVRLYRNNSCFLIINANREYVI